MVFLGGFVCFLYLLKFLLVCVCARARVYVLLRVFVLFVVVVVGGGVKYNNYFNNSKCNFILSNL